jgi:hypothetical protein
VMNNVAMIPSDGTGRFSKSMYGESSAIKSSLSFALNNRETAAETERLLPCRPLDSFAHGRCGTHLIAEGRLRPSGQT